MKTASFITIHVGFNFGSKLQAIATFEILKNVGYNPICVNYIPSRVTYKRYWKEAIVNPIKFLWRLIYFPIYLITRRNLLRVLISNVKSDGTDLELNLIGVREDSVRDNVPLCEDSK